MVALALGLAEVEVAEREEVEGCEHSLHIAPALCLQRTSLHRHTSILRTNLRTGSPDNLLALCHPHTNPHHRTPIHHTSWRNPRWPPGGPRLRSRLRGCR